MWPPLAAITRADGGQKPLQTFLTKPLFIDSHAGFTEALNSSVLVWHVLLLLKAYSSIYANKLKQRRFKSGDCGAKSSYWRPTSLAQSLLVYVLPVRSVG